MDAGCRTKNSPKLQRLRTWYDWSRWTD